MGSLDLFSEKSDLYATARPQYPQELFEFLFSCVTNHDLVWDCATGNGQAAIGLANLFKHVQATDMSEQQITHALANENVTYSVQSAEQTNFSDQCFDLVTVAQALHWFNFEKFWPEVIRVLKPGGVFSAWGYGWFKVSPEIDDVINCNILQVIESYWAKQNQLIWNGYADIDFPFQKIPSPKISMNQQWSLAQLLAYIHTWSATRLCMQDRGTGFFEDAAKKIEVVWGDPSTVREIRMDIHLYAGRK